jgi:hypothetical protein
MAVGVSPFLANGWLNTIKSTGTSFNIAGNIYTELHTGSPGSAGTANISSTTTRPTMQFTTATTGVLLSTSSPSWASWAGTNGEVVTNISFWDTSLGPNGNFLWSASLSSSKTINTGDTFTLTTATLTIVTAT